MRKIPLLGLLVSLFLVAVVIMAALPAPAQGQTFCIIHGTVTVNGSPADVGTSVEVFIVDSDTVSTEKDVHAPGKYSIGVYSGGGDVGKDLRFEVGGEPAQAMPDDAVFTTTAVLEINLVVGGGQTGHILTVTVSPAGAGMVTKDPSQGGYPDNTEVTLTATPNGGNTFIGWTGNVDSGGNPTTITMNSDETVTASFELADPNAIIRELGPGWNVISTPIWLDEDADRTRDILPEGYEGYRWSGSSWKSLSKSYTWEPLEAFYVKAATATFQPMVSEKVMELPNVRKLSSNKWALIGSSPADGVSSMEIGDVLAGLKDNYVNVFIPGSGASCTVGNCGDISMPAYSGAWVFVGGEKTRTIVGSYFTPVAQ